MLEYLKYTGIMIGLIIAQKTFIWLIAVTSYEITPDIVMIDLAVPFPFTTRYIPF